MEVKKSREGSNDEGPGQKGIFRVCLDIEIQVRPVLELPSRLLFYTAMMLTEQIGRGEDYDKIAKVVSIVVADYCVFPSDVRNHHRFRLYDEAAKLELSDKLEVHIIELPKTPKESDHSRLWLWSTLLAAETKGELDMLYRLRVEAVILLH